MPRRTLAVLNIATLVGLAPSLVIAFVLLAPGPDWVDRYGFYVGRDFVNFWTAGRLAIEGRLSELYDLAAYHAVIKSWFAPSDRFLNFSYPPHTLLFLWPLGLLPYGVALGLWSALGVAGFLLVTLTGVDPRLRRGLLPALLLGPIALLNLTFAQAGFFWAALFVGALRVLPTRPVLAGALFGILTVKPHLGLIVPPALLVMRERRAFAVAALATLALVGLSLVPFGAEPWRDYLANTVPYQGRVVTELTGLVGTMMITPYTAAWWLGAPAQLALTIHAAIAGLVACAALAALRWPVEPGLKAVLLALAAVMVTPYSLNYDLAVPAAALAVWLGSRTEPIGPATCVALGVFWLVPYVGMAIVLHGVPIGPLAVLALFATLIVEARRGLGAPAQLPALARA